MEPTYRVLVKSPKIINGAAPEPREVKDFVEHATTKDPRELFLLQHAAEEHYSKVVIVQDIMLDVSVSRY